jgi:hypothetical protein
MKVVELSTAARRVGGGGLPIPPKLLIVYKQIDTSQTDPNALKHEISHLAEYLSNEHSLYIHEIFHMEKTF